MMLVSGLIAGLIHTISGPDHLAAIAPLTTKNTNQRYRIGFYWSLGHTLGLLIFFIFALSFKDIFDLHTLSSIPEYIIAVILIYMGIRGLHSMFGYAKYADHNKRINGSLKFSFGIFFNTHKAALPPPKPKLIVNQSMLISPILN